MQRFARGFLRRVNSEVLTFAYATHWRVVSVSSHVPQWTLGKLRQNGWRKMPTELRCYLSEVLKHAMAGSETGHGALSPRLEEGVCKLVYALAAQSGRLGRFSLPPLLRCTLWVPLVT